MSGRAALDALLGAARDWHAALPELAAFCDWPEDVQPVRRAPVPIPATDLIRRDPGATTAQSKPLCDALIAAAPHVEWRLTYTEDDVGPDFLRQYGWFELAGPGGHFLSHQTRLTVGYWGPGLFYPRHQHRAEELYSVVAGHALFHADGDPDATLHPGDTRFHASDQPHAMTTTTSPVLTFVMWRGAGLGDAPGMTR